MTVLTESSTPAHVIPRNGQSNGRPAKGRARPTAATLAAALIVLSTIAVALFAHPLVGTFELQRRDRQPASSQFVAYAYAYLLNRTPDAEGLATYTRIYDERGAEAVVQGIATSEEYRRRAIANARADGPPALEDQDAGALAFQVVQTYQSTRSDAVRPDDGLGRIGFVAGIIGCVMALTWLSKRSRRAEPAERSTTYLPAGYIVGAFSALAFMFWASSGLYIQSFAPSQFWYVEWLSQATALAIARGPWNVWTPYPQGTQYAIVGLQLAANSVASIIQSDIWTASSLFRIWFQFLFLIVPSIASVFVVQRIGVLVSREVATIAGLGAALSFAPIYYGFNTTQVTDPLAVAFALAAIWLMMRNRSMTAGLCIGVGAALKLFPLLVLPAALVCARSWAARARIVCATAATLAIVFLPAAVANPETFMSPIRWQSSRPPWETWYAFANWLVSAPHEFRTGYFRDIAIGDAFGWVFWGITPSVSALLTPVPQGPPRWENLVSIAGTATTIVLVLAARSPTSRSLARWALFCVSGFMLWAIGWSPQYELYLVPLILLALRPVWIGLLAASILQALTLLEYPVLLPWAYFYGGSPVWLAWAAIMGREILLAWLCWYVIREEADFRLAAARIHSVVPTFAAVFEGWGTHANPRVVA